MLDLRDEVFDEGGKEGDGILHNYELWGIRPRFRWAKTRRPQDADTKLNYFLPDTFDDMLPNPGTIEQPTTKSRPAMADFTKSPKTNG